MAFSQFEGIALEEEATMNTVKTNITGIFLRNYSIQAERVINKSFSFNLQYRWMPEDDLPFKSYLEDNLDFDNDVEDFLASSKISGYAITPEIRWYVGKGFGHGFYISPYYRYSKFDLKSIPIYYTRDDDMEDIAIGTITYKAHSFGLMFGAQWKINDRFVIDWWILGGHFGNSSGNLDVTSTYILSNTEQQLLQEEIDSYDLDVVGFEFDHQVKPNGVKSTFTGKNIGIRAGISIGFAF